MRKLISSLCFVASVFAAVHTAPQTSQPTRRVADDFASAEPAPPLPEPLKAALAGITAPALAARIAFLAAPNMEGRGLGSRGLETAAEYVAASLALAGVPPLAEAGPKAPPSEAYFQLVPLRQLGGAGGEVTVERRSGEEVRRRSFLSGVDCLFPPLPPQSVTAPVVFAGYGIREREPARDDYSGLDARGRIVLVLAGLPGGAEWQKAELVARYGSEKRRERFAAKLELARTLGAAAVMAVEGDDLATRVLANEPPEEGSFLPYDGGAEAPPLVRVSPVAADAVLAAAGLNVASARIAAPRDLAGVTVTIRVTASERLIASRNVVGTLAGTDPALRTEAVVIGAHVDHLGTSGKAVYPGADDNASGVAALLEIARAFADSKARPKRTLVFAFWTGEEEGKLGSGYWVKHPLWPLARTTVYLNLDMIGHPWTMEEIRTLVADTRLPKGEEFLARVKPADFAEPGLPVDAPELAAALLRAGPGTGLALHLDRTDGTSGGSDYRDFARAGVPWVRFFGNFFPAYHESGDTAGALDAAQVQRMARFCFATAWLLADR